MPGYPVKEGQTIFNLVPITDARRDRPAGPATDPVAEGQVKSVADQLKIAKVNLERAERLAAAKLGGGGAVVDAQAQFDLA